jgi:hypothetical protein
VNCVAFPDDGAAKRFKYMFTKMGYEIVICGKVRLRFISHLEQLPHHLGHDIIVHVG